MKKGFTFIEVIIVIAIFTIVLGAISSFSLNFYNNQKFISDYSNIVDQAKFGVFRMVKELREAKTGEDGSYPLIFAGDKEIVFFADVDNDGVVEKVRYFLGSVQSADYTQTCSTNTTGGSCSVVFSNFFNGTLVSASAKVSGRGDLNQGNEYFDVFADGVKLGQVCKSGCSQCGSSFEGTQTFDVLSQARDNSLVLTADATNDVNICNPKMEAKFELSVSWNDTSGDNILKKEVTEPTGDPPKYLSGNSTTTVISNYVINTPPIFQYYDKDGNIINDTPARLKDTKLIRVYLVIDNDINTSPKPFELETFVNIRNLNE